MKLRQLKLPYHRDSSTLFASLAAEPWSIFLDSGFPYKENGRYDILSARPGTTLTTYGSETTITTSTGSSTSQEDPFSLLKKSLGNAINIHTQFPFIGGALGYFAYDLGRRIETIPTIAKHDIQMPDMAVGIYDWAVVVDHETRQSWLISRDDAENDHELEDIRQLLETPPSNDFPAYQPLADYECNFDQASYTDAFTKIQHYITEGDCYQVNLAQRFSVPVEGHPWAVYKLLRELNPAPFAGYLLLPDCAILSSSPERFLKVSSDQVETKPIKGTRRRSVFAYEDKALAQELLESEKDRAENVMIVDLLRNDLGKTCKIGSVSVPKLYALESYATVHHLVSTVVGVMPEDSHALDLLRGCFPGGSITGAPKVRAMEIIEELEPHRRNVYCGSMGYIGFDGNMDTSITIRTLVHHNEHLYCWAGGGIVIDSTAPSEYQECFDKAEAMLKLFRYQAQG